MTGRPRCASELDSQLQTTPDKARLAQKVFANKANDYGNKADSYVALLTVLAVGLFLIGLSLTVSGRGRYFLAMPGVVIAIVCVGWGALITASSITKVSPNAIDLTAQGQALQSSGDAKGAIDKYNAAIKDSPQFGAAFARLADAEFQAGASSSAGNEFQSLSDPEATKRAIDAGEKAISLGEGNASLLSSVGFFHFALGEYDRAEELSQQALDSNDQFPPLVFNLGVVQWSPRGEEARRRGDLRAAASICSGRSRTGRAAPRGPGRRRTDLEMAVDHHPREQRPCAEDEGPAGGGRGASSTTDPAPDGKPADASVTDVKILTDRFRLFASYTADGFDPNTPLANVWYFRPLDKNGQGPFEQVFPLDRATLTGGNPVCSEPVENGDCLPGGDYRVEILRLRLAATADSAHRRQPASGTLIVDGGETPVTMSPGLPGAASGHVRAGPACAHNPERLPEFVLVFSPDRRGFRRASGRRHCSMRRSRTPSSSRGSRRTVRPWPAKSCWARPSTASTSPCDHETTASTPLVQRQDHRLGGPDDWVQVVIVERGENPADLDVVRSELVNSIRFLRVPATVGSNGG